MLTQILKQRLSGKVLMELLERYGFTANEVEVLSTAYQKCTSVALLSLGQETFAPFLAIAFMGKLYLQLDKPEHHVVKADNSLISRFRNVADEVFTKPH